MTKEEILNLNEDERKKFVKNPNVVISTNQYTNSIIKIEIALTLSEKSRKEIIRDNNTGLTSYDILKIALTLSEESRKDIAKDNNVNLSDYDRKKVMLSLSKNSRNEIVRDKKVKLDFDSRMQIILTLDEETIKDILQNEKLSLKEKEKIKSILNEDKRKEMLKDKRYLYKWPTIISELSEKSKLEIFEEKNFSLGSISETMLIASLSEEAKIQLFEENKKRLSYAVIDDIISSLSDEGKIQILRNDKFLYDREEILLELSEEAKIKILVDENFELDSFEKEKIILSLSGDAKKEILKNKNIKLDASLIKEIIIRLDEESKKEFLNDENINLDFKEKVEIILTLGKKNRDLFLKQLNKEEKKILEPIHEILEVNSNPTEALKKFSQKIGKVQMIDLPKNMKIGIELEAEGKNAFMIKALGSILPNWKSKNDISLKDGVEVVSPILKDNTEDMKSLELVCDLMLKVGLRADELCGGHIHIGADYLGNNFKAWENLVIIWNESEELLYKMSNEKEKIPRDNTKKFAKTSHNKIEELYTNGKVKIEKEEDFSKICEILTDTKYRGLNLINLGKEDKNTIEYRMPNGTLNTKTIKENIKLFGSLLQVSKEMALKPEYKKEEFIKLKDRNLTEGEKVEALLDLLFDDEKIKNIYRQRWDSVKGEKQIDKIVKRGTETLERGNYKVAKKENFKKVSLDKYAIQEVWYENITKIIERIRKSEKNQK